MSPPAALAPDSTPAHYVIPAPVLALLQPSSLMDEIHVCLLRALAVDETPTERAERELDLSLLDHMTWPVYVWEWLRLTGKGGGGGGEGGSMRPRRN